MAKPTTLEERITTRLHESIGDLITDEDLKGMVARGIEAALFQPRPEQVSGGFSTRIEMRPPFIQEQVMKLLSEKMSTAIQQWVKDNPEQIETALKHTLQDGVVAAMTQSLDRRFASVLPMALQNMRNQGLLPSGL